MESGRFTRGHSTGVCSTSQLVLGASERCVNERGLRSRAGEAGRGRSPDCRQMRGPGNRGGTGSQCPRQPLPAHSAAEEARTPSRPLAGSAGEPTDASSLWGSAGGPLAVVGFGLRLAWGWGLAWLGFFSLEWGIVRLGQLNFLFTRSITRDAGPGRTASACGPRARASPLGACGKRAVCKCL